MVKGNRVFNRKNIFIILSILWMIGIFIFSSRNATKSSKDSHKVGEIVAEVVVKDFKKLPKEKQESFIDSIDHIVRKTAHCFEYMVLGILVLNAGFGFKKKRLPTAGISLAITSFYAATDEFHQRFVPGRAGMVQDWLNDTLGAVVGILLMLLLETAVQHVIRKKKHMS